MSESRLRRVVRSPWWAPVLLPLLLVVPAVAFAQTPAAATLSAEQIEAQIKEVEALPGLDEAQRGRLGESYRQALAQVEAAKASDARASTYRAAVASAPRETRSIREALARPQVAGPAALPAGVGASTPLAELEQRLAQQRADLAGVESRLADLEKQLQEQQARPAVARQELADARQALEALGQETRVAPPPGESAAAAEARRVLAQARLAARTAEVSRLEQELASYSVRLDLLAARRDQVARELASARDGLRQMEDLVTQVRRSAAALAVQQAARAEQAAEAKHPVIRRLAEANAVSSEELAALTAEAEQVNALREASEARLWQLQQDFQGARQKLEVAGLSQAIGKVLIEQRNRLPDERRLLTRVDLPPLALESQRHRRLGEVGLAQVQVEEERRQIADVGRATERLVATQVDGALPVAERDAIRAEVARLLKDRQQLLQQLGAAQGGYLRQLGELEFAQKRLKDLSASFREFLNEHLLWTPSLPPMGSRTGAEVLAAAAWLVSPENWLQVLRVVRVEVNGAPALTALTAFGLGALGWAGLALRRRVAAASGQVGKPTVDRFALTVEGLVDTVLLALPLPLLMWIVGSRLQFSAEATDFTQAVGTGLRVGAPFLLNAGAFLRLSAPGGLAAVHFRWPEASLRQLRRQLRLAVTLGLPLAVLGTALGVAATEAYRSGLSRTAFLGLMALFAVILMRLFRPDGPVLQSYFAAHPQGWLCRLRRAWFPITWLLPAALAVLAALGYYYSATQLAMRTVNTLWLLMGAVVLHGLVVRWLTLTRSRLALQLARERREAALAVRDAKSGASEGPAEGFAVDLAAVDAQTRKLLRTLILLAMPVGLWLIWADVTPALNILERVHLWSQTQVVDGQEKMVPVTLGSLALALVIGIVAAAAARNLPGLLDLAVFRHMSIEPGSRYAIAKTTSYVIAGVGALLVFGTVGLSWSQVQWLVAALGVGLGFGLQEIFANFISGLIILFERPVRVGDTVTVG
ncbi:MAG: mechanosensitive ion channel, partial [Gammaproteobacteria bacterium]|nr:mechanosensitive ion channel [Gammaproteobacteria bacterium]